MESERGSSSQAAPSAFTCVVVLQHPPKTIETSGQNEEEGDEILTVLLLQRERKDPFGRDGSEDEAFAMLCSL